MSMTSRLVTTVRPVPLPTAEQGARASPVSRLCQPDAGASAGRTTGEEAGGVGLNSASGFRQHKKAEDVEVEATTQARPQTRPQPLTQIQLKRIRHLTYWSA